VVTICTTSLTFNNSTFCPHSVFMCFVWISEQTAIISLYNINWLVFVTQPQCVYCAVRTEALYVIQANSPCSVPVQSADIRYARRHIRTAVSPKSLFPSPGSITFSYMLQLASRLATLLQFMSVQTFLLHWMLKSHILLQWRLFQQPLKAQVSKWTTY